MTAGVAIPLAFGVESTRETITFGQINMLLVVLVLADLLLGVPRGSRWTGVGIGLATAPKLYPGIETVRRVRHERGMSWQASKDVEGQPRGTQETTPTAEAFNSTVKV